MHTVDPMARLPQFKQPSPILLEQSATVSRYLDRYFIFHNKKTIYSPVGNLAEWSK